MDRLMASVARELRQRMKLWPEEMSAALGRHLMQARAPTNRARGMAPASLPYWFIVPEMLWRKYRRSEPGASSTSFLRDILLGQYCLFLSVHIQDDFLDRQADAPALVFVASQLMLEARQAFARHFPENSPFWRFFEDSVCTSASGIFRVDRLQRKPASRPQVLLNEYARVAAIFKIGTLAVCRRTDRMRQFARLAACADRLAVFSQILDDLEDMTEDLARGRYNYGATILLRHAHLEGPNRKHVADVLARELYFGGGWSRISSTLRRQIASAVECSRSLHLEELERYFRLRLRFIDHLNRTFHKESVRAIFPVRAGKAFHRQMGTPGASRPRSEPPD